MFSGPLIGILAAISAAVYIYTWTMRRTGNNTQNAATLAGLGGVVVFVVVWIVAATIDSTLG
jgi:uncharacterized membrane-anchored protein